MKKQYDLKDSGERVTFNKGAQRDRSEGKGRFDLLSPFALKRLAIICEKGAKKYSDRNWEKGMPFSVFIDSAFRHLTQYIMGMDDEDHIGQAMWNLMCIIHFDELGLDKEWDNMPHYLQKSLFEHLNDAAFTAEELAKKLYGKKNTKSENEFKFIGAQKLGNRKD